MNRAILFRYTKMAIFAIALVLSMNFLNAAWSNPTAPPTGGNPDVPVNVSNNPQTKLGDLNLFNLYAAGNVGIGTVAPAYKLDVREGRVAVGEAGNAYSYIVLRDDESPNGVKYVHANSNVIGFLSGAGSWLSYWDNAGNQQNIGGITASGDICTNVAGGKCLSTVGGTTFGGMFTQSPLYGCTWPNPLTGGCSCSAGNPYGIAHVVDGGFWSNQHPVLYVCL